MEYLLPEIAKANALHDYNFKRLGCEINHRTVICI
jgi:hypothetical protein